MRTTRVQVWGDDTAKDLICDRFVENKVSGKQSGFSFEYLTQRGSIFYGVMKREHADSDEINYFGIVIKTSSRTPKGGRREICCKEMTEDMGPYFYDAPLKMLNMLDSLAPNPGEGAATWRAKCREVQRKKALKNAIPWQGGDLVEYGGNTYKLLKPATQKPGWRVQCEKTSQVYRMRPAQLKNAIRKDVKVEVSNEKLEIENLELFAAA